MVKRYLKSGVMENGVVTETKEGSPQGGNLSPLLANVYLNEIRLGISQARRAVHPLCRTISYCWRKSERAAERLLESSTKYLEGNAEAESESGKEPDSQCIRNPKF